jgi:hypothetical protein
MVRFIRIRLLLAAVLLITACGPKRHFVVSKVRSAARLASTETVIDKVVIGTKTKKVLRLLKVSEANFVAYTEATVKTGIDLEKLREEDIVIEDKKITLTLPSIEVLDFQYPFDKFRIDSAITGNAFLNRFDIVDYEEFYRMAELDIRENLQYTGIIQQTRSNTEQLMRGLLENLGYEEVYISFREQEPLFKPLNFGGREDAQ